MSAQHPCMGFWKQWSDQLFVFFEGVSPPVGPGAGRRMSRETYAALCNLQRALERAVGQPPASILSYEGPASPPPLPPGDEALLQACILQMMAALVNDELDPSSDGHASGPGWVEDGNAQPGAVEILFVAPSPPPQPRKLNPPGTDLLGRVRNVLGP